MSRRDSSRVHIAVRQNDTLAEFENFKKKFLFANKQITKQNCSLSMKIEELNAHISTLYVENLRLRASEIALQSQLKREKVKSHKIMADAEAAVLNLLKHFGIIRESYNVPTERPRSPKDPKDPTDSSSSPSTRCTRKPPPRSPTAPRYAALPSVPDIDEEPEPHEMSSGENALSGNDVQFPLERMDTLVSSGRRRTSISRLPVPSRASTPPPGSEPLTLDEGGSTATAASRKRKKLSRRASGIISPSEPLPRPISPVLGSPMQQDIDLSAEEAAAAMQVVEDFAAKGEEKEQEQEVEVKKPRKKTKTRDDSGTSDVVEKKERKKAKERERDRDRDPGSAPRLKDVTNSPRRRRAAASSTTAPTGSVAEDRKEESPASGRPTLAISPPLKLSSESDVGYLPTPLPSSTATSPVAQHFALPSSDAEINGGRDRRSRKSVNYAEPKLNTKMRKPDVIPPLSARHSLSSFASTITTGPTSSSLSSSNQNHTRSSPGLERSSPELEETDMSPSTRPSSSSKSSSSKSSSSSNPLTSERVSSSKRKHRGHVRTPSEEGMATEELGDEDDQDDDTDHGGEADSEYSEFRAWANVNLGSRKKGGAVMPNGLNVNGVSGHGLRDDGFGRRHSMAV